MKQVLLFHLPVPQAQRRIKILVFIELHIFTCISVTISFIDLRVRCQLPEAPSHGVLPATSDENKLSQTQSVVPAGKGVVIPSSGECPKPFSKMAFIGIVMCSIHAQLISQCPKAIVIENKYYLQITIEEAQRSASGQGLLDMLMPDGC